MCGIAGIVSLSSETVPDLERRLTLMNRLQGHRGPDGERVWQHPRGRIGLAHRRLSIIDLSPSASQPMTDGSGNWVVYNGEIYNYLELRAEMGEEQFATRSDTEVILQGYRRWGAECVTRFRGMFAFALWDEATQTLVCGRDRFGIKPLYYTIAGGVLYFASEAKALLPFVERIETDVEAFKDYLTFQFCLAGKTLFKGIHEVLPAHTLRVTGGVVRTERYWDVYYTPDFDRTPRYFEDRLRTLVGESVRLHLRSDVPLGAYVSGGLDSSVIAALARRETEDPLVGFTGKFSYSPEYDESRYACALAESCKISLFEIDITADDFVEVLPKVIYHLDYPAAGPGSFPQYLVARLAGRHRKVVLGGQGGDEIFGGYPRYLIAYFEQCIKAAIDGTMHSGNFIVTYESIIPNLASLRSYKPLLQEFWREGLFEDMDRRYFRLINRAPGLGDEIRWHLLGEYSPYETFRRIFHGENVGKQSYFDLMTHFDFKTLLPALLQVEDRMSMAHGVESRVPLLDHPLVEFAATMPSTIKFRDGEMKHIFKRVFRTILPNVIAERQDKMGFPTPVTEWIKGDAYAFVRDTLSSRRALSRDLIDNRQVLRQVSKEPKFGRNIWGFLCLELWQQIFHDREAEFKHQLHLSQTRG